MRNKFEIENVITFPGYDVAVPKKFDIFGHQAFRLNHGDELACAWPSRVYGSVYSLYKISSVFGYARDNDECPEAMLKLFEKNNDEKYHIFGLGACITSSKSPKKTYISVTEGDIVRFEGKMFRIEKTWNHNLKLVQV